jgi:hypothetical protein
MKVEQEKFGFEPIHITLYSKTEADIMWAALKRTSGSSPYSMLTSHNTALKFDQESQEIAYQMFCAFDDVHGCM